MNEPGPKKAPLGDFEDFRECAAIYADMHLRGWITLQNAVDNVQQLGEMWGLIEDIGQDEVQAEMAFAFMAADLVPSDHVASTLVRWELADPRDRWKHTGELPPHPEPAPPVLRAYHTPQSTVDAFWFLARQGNADALSAWLADHPLDAPHLHKLWEAKCSTAAA